MSVVASVYLSKRSFIHEVPLAFHEPLPYLEASVMVYKVNISAGARS